MSISAFWKSPEVVMSMAFPVVAALAMLIASPATLFAMFRSIALLVETPA